LRAGGGDRQSRRWREGEPQPKMKVRLRRVPSIKKTLLLAGGERKNMTPPVKSPHQGTSKGLIVTAGIRRKGYAQRIGERPKKTRAKINPV